MGGCGGSSPSVRSNKLLAGVGVVLGPESPLVTMVAAADVEDDVGGSNEADIGRVLV